MTDFSAYLAGLIVDWMSQDTQMPTPPTDLYVTLYDDTGTELNGDVQNGRVAVTAPDGWNAPDTAFENASEVNFGEATADITVQEVALYDGDPGAGANELARYAISEAPKSIDSGTRVFFAASELSFDVLD